MRPHFRNALISCVVGSALTLGLSQQATAGWPYKSKDPSVPPSTSPTNSTSLNNFGSDWLFSHSLSPADVDIDFIPPDTLTVRGLVVGGEAAGGEYLPGRQAVWDADIVVTGVSVDFGDLDPDPATFSGPYTQTVTYTANLLEGGVITGTLQLNAAETLAEFGSLPTPKATEPQNPADWFINIGADVGPPPTSDLNTSGPLTFPADGQLGDNQVLRFEETRGFGQDPGSLFPAAVSVDRTVDPSGIPTPPDGPSADLAIFDAVNHVLGTSFSSNADLEPLYVAPDSLWKRLGDESSPVALIGLSAGNSNTLGVSYDPSDMDILGPDSGFELEDEPFPGTLLELAPDTDFAWYLRSASGSASTTFYSDPGRNSDNIDHMLTYDLTMLDPDPVDVLLPSGDTVSVTPQYLITWEDLVGGGDADYNDAMYMVGAVTTSPASGFTPLGSDPGPFVELRYCHSHSLLEGDPADCIRDDGLPATGATKSLTLASSCPGGAPATGAMDVMIRANSATIDWMDLSCGDDSGSKLFRPVKKLEEAGNGTPLSITAINGELWTTTANEALSVNGPGDKGPQKKTIEGNEKLVFVITDATPPTPDAFLGASVAFWVGKDMTQTVQVTATDRDGNAVYSQSLNVTSLPGSALSAPVTLEIFEPFVELMFEPVGDSSFGIADLAIGTVVE